MLPLEPTFYWAEKKILVFSYKGRSDCYSLKEFPNKISYLKTLFFDFGYRSAELDKDTLIIEKSLKSKGKRPDKVSLHIIKENLVP